MENKKILTIPNVMSFARIILIPIFMVLYLNESFYIIGIPIFAMLVFLLGFALDILDGIIARNFNQESRLGKVLDPLSDKLFRLSILLCFMIKNVLPLYVFIILLVVDIASIIIATYLYFKHITVQANIAGKISTAFMCLALFSCFLHETIKPVDLILVLVAIGLVICSMIIYLVKYYKIYKRY